MLIDFENLLTRLTSFYYSQTIVAIALAVVLLLLIFFRPKATLKTAGIVLALAVAVYLFTLFIDTAGTGRSHKKEMIHTVQ
jgi:amino acid permease